MWVIIWSANGLNTSIKRQISRLDFKKNSSVCCYTLNTSTQIESKIMKIYIIQTKGSLCGYTNIRQGKLQGKKCTRDIG